MQALQFLGCDNLKLGPLRHIDSPKNHISIADCNGALISHLHIIAPENSPNTDGIDISRSTNIIIDHSTISTGIPYSYIFMGLFFPPYQCDLHFKIFLFCLK